MACHAEPQSEFSLLLLFLALFFSSCVSWTLCVAESSDLLGFENLAAIAITKMLFFWSTSSAWLPEGWGAAWSSHRASFNSSWSCKAIGFSESCFLKHFLAYSPEPLLVCILGCSVICGKGTETAWLCKARSAEQQKPSPSSGAAPACGQTAAR